MKLKQNEQFVPAESHVMQRLQLCIVVASFLEEEHTEGEMGDDRAIEEDGTSMLCILLPTFSSTVWSCGA